jgi:RNA polymerase sigma factor (sigma-70 family)
MTTDVNTSKMSHTNLNQVLLDRCKTGDQKAQFQIYKMYYKAMYNTSLRIVNNAREAEDIMQESFLSAFEKIGTYSGTVSFGAWLKKMVINHSLDFIKKERNVFFEDIYCSQEKVCNSIVDLPRENETNLKIQDVIDVFYRLPERYRIVISLYLLEGYDHEEIGEILSISPVTSMSHFSKARHSLMQELRGN